MVHICSVATAQAQSIPQFCFHFVFCHFVSQISHKENSDRHKNFENWFRNGWETWIQRWHRQQTEDKVETELWDTLYIKMFENDNESPTVLTYNIIEYSYLYIIHCAVSISICYLVDICTKWLLWSEAHFAIALNRGAFSTVITLNFNW